MPHFRPPGLGQPTSVEILSTSHSAAPPPSGSGTLVNRIPSRQFWGGISQRVCAVDVLQEPAFPRLPCRTHSKPAASSSLRCALSLCSPSSRGSIEEVQVPRTSLTHGHSLTHTPTLVGVVQGDHPSWGIGLVSCDGIHGPAPASGYSVEVTEDEANASRHDVHTGEFIVSVNGVDLYATNPPAHSPTLTHTHSPTPTLTLALAHISLHIRAQPRLQPHAYAHHAHRHTPLSCPLPTAPVRVRCLSSRPLAQPLLSSFHPCERNIIGIYADP